MAGNGRMLAAATAIALAGALAIGGVAQAGTTKLVKDIRAGAEGGSPQELTAYKGKIYFTAVTPEKGRELWKSDGTRAGTKLVKDIWPGTGWGDPSELTVVDGILYFRARRSSDGVELWRSDGTKNGHPRVKDIRPGSLAPPRET